MKPSDVKPCDFESHPFFETAIAVEKRGDWTVEFRCCETCQRVGWQVYGGTGTPPQIWVGDAMEHLARHLGRPELAPPAGWRTQRDAIGYKVTV